MSAHIERWDPPADPTAFESLCLDLFREIWQDLGAQKVGRSGQSQAGVDVIGQHQGEWSGVQCKQKNGLPRTNVSMRELKEVVNDARRFVPPLAKLVLATTGPRDANVQRRARELSEEHKQQGLFRVEIWAWDDIWHDLYQREELLKRIAPIYWPRLTAVRSQEDFLIAPTRLPQGAERLFGREDDLKRIDEAWDNLKTRILTIVGWGGVGKTSLVVEWMNRKATEGWPGFERIFDWSFYSQGAGTQGAASADTFVAEALRFFGDQTLGNSPASPWEKGARLAELAAVKRTLLVLDGLEPLQHPPGPLGGQLKDLAIEALLKALVRQRNPGLCIVTTRERIADLAPFEDTPAAKLQLKRLSTAAGIELLRTVRVRGTPAELEKLVNDVGGHALTLNLIGRFIAHAFNGDIRKRDLVRIEEADAEFKTNAADVDNPHGHAFKVMAAYERWLNTGGKNAQRQLAVLQLLGLFDRAADAGCLEALRRPPAIHGLTDFIVNLSEAQWNFAVSRLVDCGLVWPTGANQSESWNAVPLTGLDAHPLIREYFAVRLVESHPASSLHAHRRLFNHLKQAAPELPATVTEMIHLYSAIRHACSSGLCAEALHTVYWPRISRGRNSFFSTNQLGAWNEDLQLLTHFFRVPYSDVMPSLDVSDAASLLRLVGFQLRSLGRLQEAVEPTETALKLAELHANQFEATTAALNLSRLYVALGNIDLAEATSKRSISIAAKWGDASSVMRAVCRYAHTLHLRGCWEDSEQEFRRAEQIQSRLDPEHPLLHSLWGYYLYEFLLDRGEYVEVLKRSEQTLRWALDGSGDRFGLLDIALHRLSIGQALLAQTRGITTDKFRLAEDHINSALRTLRSAGTLDELPRGLIARALLASRKRELSVAQANFDEAWQVAERGPMRLHMADIHVHRARLFGDKAELQKARALIERCGYWRRKTELEDIEMGRHRFVELA